MEAVKLLALTLSQLSCLAWVHLHRRAILPPEQLTNILTLYPRWAEATWLSAITSPSCKDVLSGRWGPCCVIHLRRWCMMEHARGRACSCSSFTKFRGHIWRRHFLRTVGYSYHKKSSCAAIKSVKGVWGGGFFHTQKREKTKGGDVLGGGEEELKKKREHSDKGIQRRGRGYVRREERARATLV